MSRHVATVWQPRKAYYLLLVNEFFEVSHCQLFPCLIFFQLLLDIFLNLFCILSCCIYLIPSAPEFPVPIFILQFRILFVDHQTALSFEISHKTGDLNLWRYLYQHMHVIRTHFRFHNFYLFPFAKCSQYFSYFTSLFSVEYFSSIFWCEHDVIFPIPFCIP